MDQSRNLLLAGQYLLTNQSLYSNNGQYTLKLQDDANLVIYYTSVFGESPVWATGVYRPYDSDMALTLQNDGNLVQRRLSDLGVIWQLDWNHSFTFNCHSPCRMILGDDGSLKIFDSDNELVWGTQSFSLIVPRIEEMLKKKHSQTNNGSQKLMT